jgi:hypothetical protein
MVGLSLDQPVVSATATGRPGLSGSLKVRADKPLAPKSKPFLRRLSPAISQDRSSSTGSTPGWSGPPKLVGRCAREDHDLAMPANTALREWVSWSSSSTFSGSVTRVTLRTPA